jgi:hypothetical protein
MTYFDSESDDRFVIDSRQLLRALLHPELRADQGLEPPARDQPGAVIYPELAIIYPDLPVRSDGLLARLAPLRQLRASSLRRRLSWRFR